MLIAMIALPLLTAVLLFVVRNTFSPKIALTAASLIFMAALNLTVKVAYDGPVRYQVGGWGSPVGIDLNLDGLSTLMLLTAAAVGLAVSLFAQGYFSRNLEGLRFWPLWFIVWGALNALFLSSDLFNLYVSLEVMSIGSVALVALGKDVQALSSALRYLLTSVIGSLFYLMGVVILYGSYSTLDLTALSNVILPEWTTFTAIGMITMGLMVKAALFPVHFWLPPAHANAPAPVSAILSGLVIMAAFYILVRFWFGPFAPVVTLPLGQALGLLGVITIIYSSVKAFKQERLKMLLAYSTVAQVGYMFLLFPLAAEHTTGEIFAWSGGLYFALSHAFAKASAFMVAGSIMFSLGHDKIAGFSGLARRFPLGIFTFSIAGLSLMGLPPSGGFIGKWQLLKAAMLSGQWGYALVIILGSLLTATYIFKVIEVTLLQNNEDQKGPLNVPMGMQYAAFSLAVISILMGLIAIVPLDIMKIDAPLYLKTKEVH